MPILYESLHVSQNATQEEIEKSYRILTYIYLNSNDKEKLLDLNTAYNVLRDPYNRAFYDKFGDRFVKNLLNPNESYFITRFFTKLNVTLLFTFIYSHIINYFFLGSIFMIFTYSNIFRFSLFIFSPILLILIHIRSSQHFNSDNPYFSRFNIATWICVLNALSILTISGNLHFSYLLLTETILNTYIWIRTAYKNNLKVKMALFLTVKSFLLMLYYTPLDCFYSFIPSAIFLSFVFVHKGVGVFLGLSSLPMCLSIYLKGDGLASKISIFLHVVHSAIGLLLIHYVTRFLIDLFVNQETIIVKALLKSQSDGSV
ncbi:uncharacterized protein VICG_00703 [Vittaforma corneae ATCC 50505]|uniref:J domain-containing protein n=1 Tax=Vittaforma corneae (strain ATCC 50505) TaxID=993615 RepID=L2GN28_VITCO|nr:uncharacterized protein VICG_00703 [Vittaforma corneae ATCC 50505]ELA42303.1 hypothetical protein VICG_00703 [Vittaforma corneae ATCC 50505]